MVTSEKSKRTPHIWWFLAEENQSGILEDLVTRHDLKNLLVEINGGQRVIPIKDRLMWNYRGKFCEAYHVKNHSLINIQHLHKLDLEIKIKRATV